LTATLSQIVKQAFEADSKDFIRIIREATELAKNEDGTLSSFKIVGRLVKLKPEGEALAVSDLHGDLESLVDILKGSGFLRKMNEDKKALLVLLGDYGDRGPFSAEVYYTVAKLKLLFPHQVVLMRGNHEGPEDLKPDPHDLPAQLERRFGAEWESAYSAVRGMFNHLYNAVVVEGLYLMIHGGIPQKANTLEDLAHAHQTHPDQKLLEDMLWSDPDDCIKGTTASPRGAGKLFGEDVTRNLLGKLDLRVLIRGHEPCEQGFKINHSGKVLTLFSRKGPPYFNAHGAYLRVSLSEKYENANQLVPYIHRL